MRDHRKLRAFTCADELVLRIYNDTLGFPREEIFGLTSQMRRGSVSVASNIVEGCARHTQADYLRFLDIAYGAAKELEYQLSVAFRLGYMDEEAYEATADLCGKTASTLNALIGSYNRRRTKKK